jgi:hypothetical protein
MCAISEQLTTKADFNIILFLWFYETFSRLFDDESLMSDVFFEILHDI